MEPKPKNTGLCEVVLKWDSVTGVVRWLILFAVFRGQKILKL